MASGALAWGLKRIRFRKGNEISAKFVTKDEWTREELSSPSHRMLCPCGSTMLQDEDRILFCPKCRTRIQEHEDGQV